MISIYDVLKASKGLPVREPIACHWGRKLGGGAAGYGELTGAPPLTFTANGRNLINYRIYGANDGVGEQTENLFDKTSAIPNKQYDRNGNLTDPIEAGTWYASGLIKVEPNNKYVRSKAGETIGNVVNFYNGNKTFQSRNTPGAGVPFTIPSTTEYISFAINADSNPIEQYMLTAGSTAPAQYIPYGYQINAEVGDGVTTTNIPIYIGDTPLAPGEYADYGEQKVYKYVDSTLTPTDPPVELPALPTIDGTTVADFDNEPKPSEMYIKYPK